jgi:mono/diheme cytochrome c family protein
MRRSIKIFKIFSCAAALLTQPPAALAAGDAAAGKVIAEQWCSSCHVVTPEQKTASTEAPPFATIAARHADSMDALAAFLADPHPPMPQMSLARQEIQDLLAYIGSLK